MARSTRAVSRSICFVVYSRFSEGKWEENHNGYGSGSGYTGKGG